MAVRSRLLIVFAAFVALGTAEAHAHGTSLSPASRSYICRYLDRESEPCAYAWRTNPQAIYDWMGILIARADGRHRELIGDGSLCSAGDAKFGAFDRPSTAWPATGLSSGRQTWKWVLNAPHATRYYRFYLTREGFDPGRALRWDDLELIYDSGRRPATKVEEFTVDVPARTGRHVLYTVWQRSDSPEAFYSCSDVVFGAPGTVPLAPPLPDEALNQPVAPAAAPRRRAAAAPLKLSSRGIRLRRKVDNDWGAGYCATVTVTNRSRSARAWKASMRLPHELDSIWNAVGTKRGSRLLVRGESYNRVLGRGKSTTFGFCATRRR